MDPPACHICCETFNKSSRASIDCPSCELKACRTCIRRYLTESSELPHCMGCKNRWERDFLISATLKCYVNGKYKDHRSNLLLEQEKARMPETMGDVENYLKSKQEKEKVKYIQIEIKQLHARMKILNAEKRKSYHLLWNYKHGDAGVIKTEKREFKRACPADGCRGFLSTQWRCGMCAVWVCRKCLEIKGHIVGERVGLKPSEAFPDHVCDPNSVETATLLKKDTKNCPSCAVAIFRISGCDQMWCTQCHIAFSWRTGRKVNGVVHNPHFYQWQQAGGAPPVHAPGAIMCGGLPSINNLRYVLRNFDAMRAGGTTDVDVVNGFYYDSHNYRLLCNFHQRVSHFNRVILYDLRHQCQEIADNKTLRLRYIIKEISESDMKRCLMKRDKGREKKLAILQIYELLHTIFAESLQDIYETGNQLLLTNTEGGGGGGAPPSELKNQFDTCLQKNIDRCNEVRKYSNTELVKISILYSQHVKLIKTNYGVISWKFVQKDIEKITELLTARGCIRSAIQINE
jgi:hypothetical protein